MTRPSDRPDGAGSPPALRRGGYRDTLDAARLMLLDQQKALADAVSAADPGDAGWEARLRRLFLAQEALEAVERAIEAEDARARPGPT